MKEFEIRSTKSETKSNDQNTNDQNKDLKEKGATLLFYFFTLLEASLYTLKSSLFPMVITSTMTRSSLTV